MTTSPADALVVNVAGLLGEPPGSHRDVTVDGVTLELGEGLRQAAPLALRVRVGRTNRGVVVNGRVVTSLADTCGRCLVAVELPVDAPIDEEVLPTIDLQSGMAVDTSAEPEAFRLSDHHELDLEPLARERRPAGRPADQESAAPGIARRPDKIPDPLEAEHRVVDEERDHRDPVVGVGRSRREEGA